MWTVFSSVFKSVFPSIRTSPGLCSLRGPGGLHQCLGSTVPLITGPLHYEHNLCYNNKKINSFFPVLFSPHNPQKSNHQIAPLFLDPPSKGAGSQDSQSASSGCALPLQREQSQPNGLHQESVSGKRVEGGCLSASMLLSHVFQAWYLLEIG